MFESKESPPQEELWIATARLAPIPTNTFYLRVDRALANAGFAEAAHAACAPFYEMDVSRGGGPGIDPVVYFKMLMVGFFEGLESERAIAARCADSLAIRAFLHYGLEEATPDHSTLTVIRQRLGMEVYQAMFAVLLRALKKQRLLRGKRLAIDASVLEANASLRSLAHRLTGEAYQEYVKRLAANAGVDPTDAAAVRRFDKTRPGRKTSNDEWQNPHDPDAKIGRTKRGTTRMIYKPEHIVDLDTGAIVDVDVRPGDEHDTEQLPLRVFEAEERLNAALGEANHTPQIKELTADKGYYHVDALCTFREAGIRTVISDPLDHRRIDRLSPAAQRAVRAAVRAVSSASGKASLRVRGERLERTFEHVLDCGAPGARPCVAAAIFASAISSRRCVRTCRSCSGHWGAWAPRSKHGPLQDACYTRFRSVFVRTARSARVRAGFWPVLRAASPTTPSHPSIRSRRYERSVFQQSANFCEHQSRRPMGGGF